MLVFTDMYLWVWCWVNQVVYNTDPIGSSNFFLNLYFYEELSFWGCPTLDKKQRLWATQWPGQWARLRGSLNIASMSGLAYTTVCS